MLTVSQTMDLQYRASALAKRAARLQTECRINPGYAVNLTSDFQALFLDVEREGTTYSEAVFHLFNYECEIAVMVTHHDEATTHLRECPHHQVPRKRMV